MLSLIFHGGFVVGFVLFVGFGFFFMILGSSIIKNASYRCAALCRLRRLPLLVTNISLAFISKSESLLC